MTAWKVWHDLQRRFYGTLFFVLAIAFMHVAFFPLMKGLFNWVDLDVTQLDVKDIVQNFPLYTDWRWFHEIERNVLFGIILALGGILTEARQRTILLSLSLPVTREKWLQVQFIVVLGLLFVLNLLALPILITGGLIYDQPIHIGSALLKTILLTLTAAPYIAVTLFFASITGDSIRAFLYSFAFLIFSNRLDYFVKIDPWMPETLMTQPDGIPWRPIVTIVLLTVVCFTAAVIRFKKTDY
jgi:ABC-type transport system involved in multi-copper enzyme maturation permease subunit